MRSAFLEKFDEILSLVRLLKIDVFFSRIMKIDLINFRYFIS